MRPQLLCFVVSTDHHCRCHHSQWLLPTCVTEMSCCSHSRAAENPAFDSNACAVPNFGVHSRSPQTHSFAVRRSPFGTLRGRPAQRMQGGIAEEGCRVQGLSRGARVNAHHGPQIFRSRQSIACHGRKTSSLATVEKRPDARRAVPEIPLRRYNSSSCFVSVPI